MALVTKINKKDVGKVFFAVLKHQGSRNAPPVQCEIEITKAGTKNIEFMAGNCNISCFSFDKINPLNVTYNGYMDNNRVRIYRSKEDFELEQSIMHFASSNGDINLTEINAEKAKKIIEILTA